MIRLADEGLPLRALRNRAVAEAGGEYVYQWDDDDLSHSERIAVQMAALKAAGTRACILRREILWWPLLERAAVSRQRFWEN